MQGSEEGKKEDGDVMRDKGYDGTKKEISEGEI